MSENVDWSTPAPVDTGAADGETNSDSTDQEPENTGNDTPTETGAVGIPEEPGNAVPAEKPQSKPDDSGRNTDTERTNIPKSEEKKGGKSVPRLINVNGEMVSEAELITRASKVKGSDQRFEEAARVRKQQQAFVDQLKADPMAILSDSRIDINRKELAEKWLMEELEREAADPRDAELDKYKAKEQEAARQDELRVEQEKEVEFQGQINQKKTEVADVIHKAMENTLLAKNPQIASQVLREMAMYMRSAKQQGIDVTPDELVAHVETSRYAGFHTMANSLEGEQLIEFMGKDVVNKIRRADLKRLKGNTKKSTEPTPNRAPSEKKEKRGKSMDPYEAMRLAQSKL